MKKSVVLGVLLVAALGLVQGVAAQPPDTLWTRTFGGSFEDLGSSVQQTSDNGYIIVGTTHPFALWNSDVYLIKTDATGNQVWEHTYGWSDVDDWGSGVQQTSDGGYIMVGSTLASYEGEPDIYLVKTDSVGTMVWQRTFDASSAYSVEWGNGVQQTSDGGYIIISSTNLYTGNGQDVYLIKTDAAGNSVWQRILNEYGSDCGYCVQQTSDGGYIITGYTDYYYPYSGDVLLLKTDANGYQTWERSLGGNGRQVGYSVQQTLNGGYVIAGSTNSSGGGGEDVYLIRTDSQGNSIWQLILGGSNTDWGNSVRETSDGGYIISGGTFSYGTGSSDVYLIKTDASGDTVWTHTYGGTNSDVGSSVQQTQEGGYIVAGSTSSFGAGNSDVYLIRLESESSPSLVVTLTPINPPIIIPAIGGSFNFNASVHNTTTSSQITTAWIMIQLPSGVYYGPVLGPITLTLPGGGTVTRQRTQNVPSTAPAGNYLYEARVGDYPDSVWDSDNFPFTKLGADVPGLGFGDWTNFGEDFMSAVGARRASPLQPEEFGVRISPNPFNPSTAINFELRAASYVNLRIYNTTGRLVTTLVDGWREAGVHQVTFNGSGLATGVYVYRLQAENFTTSGKMVLLK